MTHMNDTDRMNRVNPNPNPNPNPSPTIGPPCVSAAALEELEWFFERALSDIEGPCNHERMSRRLIYGGPLYTDTRQYDLGGERRAEALHAARTIYERLLSLPDLARWVIRTLFDPPRWTACTAEVEDAFGWLSPLVFELPATREMHARAEAERRTGAPIRREWLAEVVARRGFAELQPLLDEAKQAAASALAEYEETRVGFPGSVVPEPEVGR
jgi:hypothetical protein